MNCSKRNIQFEFRGALDPLAAHGRFRRRRKPFRSKKCSDTALFSPTRRFVTENRGAHGANKEPEGLVSFGGHFAGKLPLDEPNFMDATNGRIRVLLFEAPFNCACLFLLPQLLSVDGVDAFLFVLLFQISLSASIHRSGNHCGLLVP